MTVLFTSVFLLSLSISILHVPNVEGVPIVKYHCPLTKSANSSVSVENENGVRIINLNESNGRRVRIQFFYPNPFGRKRFINSGQAAGRNIPGENPTTTILSNIGDSTDATTTEYKTEFDILCNWEFHTSNSSYYLLLTFNKLSAPFSENCEAAYVAMQKANGYESRFCGQRQTTGKTQLFSKSGAKISIFRSSEAPATPPTGFSLTVEALDIQEISSIPNPLRVLVG